MKELGFCRECGARLDRKMSEGRERFFCPECGEIRYRNASPVAGVFVTRGDEILMIKRGHEPQKGTWSLPAGYLEFDEKPVEAARRELEEETGLKTEAEDLELVKGIQLEHPDQYVVGFAYTVPLEKASGTIKAGDDAEDTRFFRLEEMEDRSSSFESPRIIEAARQAVKSKK